MNANYPYNCWYLAARSDEVSRELLGRRLLDRPVVLYRTKSGKAVALEDRCAHRAYPLSRGELEGDRLVCGYHGFTYDPTGELVGVASQENVPRGICVRAFPVRETPPLVWIWLGDPAAASLRHPPELPWLTDESWAAFGGMQEVAANYLLLHEHYLDLTYALVIHSADAPPGIESMPTADQVQVSETSVSSVRTFPPLELAEWEAQATGLPRGAAYVRREISSFVSPALHVGSWQIDADASGAGDRSGAGDGRYEIVRAQAFTPAGPSSTHVVWWIARNYATDREIVGEHLESLFARHASDDKAVVETVQAEIEANPLTSDINVRADVAALKARRVVRVMIDEEAGLARVRPGYGG